MNSSQREITQKSDKIQPPGLIVQRSRNTEGREDDYGAVYQQCLNACTYCKTKHARGDLASYPIEELLVKEIPQGCMLRLGMTNPPYILEHLEEVAKILGHPRVYSFLHVPVQSASDSVLMDMKREYCCNDFTHVVDYLRERVPGVTIATDIICGFPGETDEDFEQTMDLVRKYRFPSLFINQFYPRPGTPAAKMEQVPAHVKKQRTKELSALFHSYNPYDHKVGERQSVLVTEESFDSQYYVAHNKFYEQVLVPKKAEFKGKMLEVDIYEAGKHFMRGRPVEESTVITPSISQPLERGEISGLSQSLKAAGQNGVPASLTSSVSPSSCWKNLDGQGFTLLSVGLALLAALLLFYLEQR
ncbi:Threonylcarbamoyladenosine tRNA methylthiotransferase [Bagarius yarrelli]|uniref:Threonylcarbamoyladenosine tRNA methylthiotransferase n=1 Tax=Bagarius yarrelli TaxID=175774 RepID=A0A556U1N7_BAGYA|nr:Threonylcarbamoyladenosine tRNA methylthiotransferase [Bagarius yarrelli]